MTTYIDIDLKPVKTQKASELICEMIKEEILSGKIKPGDRLPSERVLIEKLQRSRPTIREGLRLLEREGLIKIIPGSGAIVTHLSFDSLTTSMKNMIVVNNISNYELAEFRKVNEAVYSQWAAKKRTEDELLLLKKTVDDSQNYINDYFKFFEYDLKFHDLIYKASHNGIAVIVGRLIHDLLHKSLIDKYAGKSAQEMHTLCSEILSYHRNIYIAIEKQNDKDAKKWMLAHLTRFQEELAP